MFLSENSRRLWLPRIPCWKSFPRCLKIRHRFSGRTKCYPCQGLGIFRQGKWMLEIRPRLRERSWIFSSETATAFLSFSDSRGLKGFQTPRRPKSMQLDPQNTFKKRFGHDKSPKFHPQLPISLLP